jgi:hypothetical protein
MRTAILAVWALGLLGALVPTLVIVKLAFLVVGRLRDILRLATLTRTAARGVAANVVPVGALRGVGELIRPIPESLGAVTTPLRAIAERTGAVAGG